MQLDLDSEEPAFDPQDLAPAVWPAPYTVMPEFSAPYTVWAPKMDERQRAEFEAYRDLHNLEF